MTFEEKKSLILKAKNAYYNSGTPIISDYEYDKLVDEVGEESVGAPILDKFNKINISDKPMLSLEKCHSADEIISFANNGHCLVASIKCDGLSVRIIYENGKMISANTRGDGFIGQDITEHIKHFINVPLVIDFKDRLVIDGEAIIFQNDFDKINVNNDFKNPRNLAAGTLASLDTSLCKSRYMSFIAWDVIEGGETNFYSDNLSNLLSFGFTIVPYSISFEPFLFDIYKINSTILKQAEEKGIPCDGVVWKFNDIAYGNSLGKTAHHFKNGIAWKPAMTEVETNLLNIEWTMGRTGVLTPVAVFEPIEIDGSTVERASLHNVSVLEDTLNIPFVGQKVKVIKSNLIIPQIIWAEEYAIDKEILLNITNCPYCGKQVKYKTSDSGTITVHCENSNCNGQLINIINHFCSKEHGLNVKGLSRATIEKLINAGWINKRADIFNLYVHKKEWENMPGFGVKSVSNILNAIEGAKHTNFEAYLSSLGIPLIGRAVSKELSKVFTSYNDFRKAIKEGYDFTQLEGFGYEMNKAIHAYDYAEADEIAAMLTFEQIKVQTKETLNGVAANKVFVITGKLSKARSLIQADIEAAGGKMGSSVTSKTSYLVCNQPEDSAKYKAAIEKQIPIITETELYKML